MSAAARACAARGARLTELRRRVLELVWRSHRPVGAYELMPQLGPAGRGAAPPTVYRALEFLQEQRLVHRIASLNAYIGCPAPGHENAREILICRSCGRAAESPDESPARAARRSAAGLGFEAEHETIEVVGRCSDCRGDDAAKAL